jgi:membrane protease YdiL (CAAX protease family)
MIRNAIATLERPRPIGWTALVLFCAATAAYAGGSVLAVEARLLERPVAATGGLVDEALLCSAAALLVIVGGILFGTGRLRPRDVGLAVRRLPLALLITLVLWALAQLAALVVGLIHTGDVALRPAWAAGQASATVGHLMGQLLGNALFEEVAYRGFLLAQLYLLLGARSGWSPTTRLAVAAAVSSGFFALMHIPVRLHQGAAPHDLPLNLLATVVFGVFFCWIYLQTRNLFIAIGVHALVNTPTSLVECALSPQHVLYALVFVMLLVWPLSSKPRGCAGSGQTRR